MKKSLQIRKKTMSRRVLMMRKMSSEKWINMKRVVRAVQTRKLLQLKSQRRQKVLILQLLSCLENVVPKGIT